MMVNVICRLSICIILYLTTVTGKTYSSEPLNTFSLISWNVWLDDRTGAERYPRILDLLAQEEADLIALQEVTPLFLQMLSKHHLSKKYYIVKSLRQASYQNITLTKIRPDNFQTVHLPSSQGRKALLIDVSMAQSKQTMVIANVHLESPLGDEDLRRAQLNKLISATSSRPTVIAGDFNFGNDADEEQVLLPSYFDTGDSVQWREVPTYDVEKNSLAKQTKYWFEPSRRLDRIYVTSELSVEAYYQMLKHNDPLLGELSDHFGIRVDLTFTEEQPR